MTISIYILLCFLVTSIVGPNPVFAQDFRLPAPGIMVNLSPQDKFSVRLKDSVPLLDKIKKKLEEHIHDHLPQSPMRQAINYTLGLWKELNTYLQDGRFPIDNNLAENAIRPIALGRKNWLFVGSENGGHTAAVLMTFTATCRKNKINTWAYLKDVLQRIQSYPNSRLEEMLPERWQKAKI